jgi:hypothetical protein
VISFISEGATVYRDNLTVPARPSYAIVMFWRNVLPILFVNSSKSTRH